MQQPANNTGVVRSTAAQEVNGCMVFSATMPNERSRLGERFTQWISDNPQLEVRETVLVQSSDASFHCLSMVAFYMDSTVA